MYQILLAPMKVTLFVDVGEGRLRTGDAHYLSYEVKAPLWVDDRRTEVRLADKEKLSDLHGVLAIYPGPIPEDSKLRVEQHHIGALSYSAESKFDDEEHPAMYGGRVWIAAPYFDQLVHTARLGKMPSSFSVEVVSEGMKYGWEPDGSGKEWDNKNFPLMPIVSLGFALRLAYDPAQMDAAEVEDGKPKLEELPATRGQMALLTSKVGALAIPGWIAAIALAYLAYRLAG